MVWVQIPSREEQKFDSSKIEQRMSEVRKGTSRNTENENKRRKIFNKVLNMNWDYVRGKRKQKENKNKQTKRKQTNKNK
jgi:hypothetical protein